MTSDWNKPPADGNDHPAYVEMRQRRKADTSPEPPPAPVWVPDWDAIFQGEPNPRGLSADELAQLSRPAPRPVPATSPCPGERYPAGDWQLINDAEGVPYWVHCDVLERAKMRCFQRRVS